MDRLTLVKAVSDVLLDVYGKRKARETALKKAFGADGAEEIQKEVNTCIGKNQQAYYMAVACIDNHYGKDQVRRHALGRWADEVQERINAIYSMRGKSITAAAKDVINGNYDKDTVRSLLLAFCGYDPDKVQAEVDRLWEGAGAASEARFRVHAIHFFRKDESAYGDCTAIYQYAPDGSIEKCVLIDTAMEKCAPVVIADLKAQGVKQIDALFISHAHGDHYSGLSAIMKAFPVKWLYLPDTTELDKHQKSYGNALRRQAKKIQNVRWLKTGESFQIGEIKGTNVFMCPASKLAEHDSHHFVNNQSMYLHFYLGDAIFDAAGDASNPANSVYVDVVKDQAAHIMKLCWHGDGNALNDARVKGVTNNGKVRTLFFSNYHHKESKGGRQVTRRRCEKFGGVVYRNWEDGQIYFDILGDKITVTTSKSGKHDTYTIRR